MPKFISRFKRRRRPRILKSLMSKVNHAWYLWPRLFIDPYTSTLNIAEVAKELGLSKFLKYAGRVSVAKLLSGEKKFTLFAPTDEAFEKLPQETLEKMKSLKWARYFVQYHVVEGKHIAESLKDEMELSSYEFQDPLRVSILSPGGKVWRSFFSFITSATRLCFTSVCRFICLSVARISEKVFDRFSCKFVEELAIAQGPTH